MGKRWRFVYKSRQSSADFHNFRNYLSKYLPNNVSTGNRKDISLNLRITKSRKFRLRRKCFFIYVIFVYLKKLSCLYICKYFWFKLLIIALGSNLYNIIFITVMKYSTNEKTQLQKNIYINKKILLPHNIGIVSHVSNKKYNWALSFNIQINHRILQHISHVHIGITL